MLKKYIITSFCIILFNNISFSQIIDPQIKSIIRYEFNEINDIDIDSKGFIYVLDKIDQHLIKFTEDGDFVSTVGSKGKGPGELLDANLFEIDNNDHLIVCNLGNGRFEILSSDGNYISSFKIPGQFGISAFKADSENNLILALNNPEF